MFPDSAGRRIYRFHKTKKSAVPWHGRRRCHDGCSRCCHKRVYPDPFLFEFDAADTIIQAGAAINPAISNVWTFALISVSGPFNIIKGITVSLITSLAIFEFYIEIYWFEYTDKEQGFLSPPFLHFQIASFFRFIHANKGSAPLSLLPILCTAYISFHVFLFRLQRLVRWFLSVSDRFLSSLSDDGFPPPFPCTPPIHGGLPPFYMVFASCTLVLVRTILTLFSIAFVFSVSITVCCAVF